MKYKLIEEKNKELIDIAKNYMSSINDSEHDINHMNDVVGYTKMILDNISDDVDCDACIIAAYWHDVGRIKCSAGHEKVSAQMLSSKMKSMNYNDEFIKKCYDAIEFHKWNMIPQTIEGLVIKDADKIAFLGSGKWNTCIKNKQRLDEIIKLLPELKNQILHFEYTKKLYDEEILKLVTILYNEVYKK